MKTCLLSSIRAWQSALSPHRLSIVLLTAVLGSGCEQLSEPASSTEVAVKGLHAAAISEDASHAVVASIHHGGSLWSIADQARLFNWNHAKREQSTIVAADFSQDGKWAVTATVSTLVLWDTASGEGLRYWNAPAEILAVALDGQGRLALLGLSDHTAVVFDIQRGGVKRTLRHNNRVRSVDISANGRFALTGSEDYSAIFWDLENEKEIAIKQHDDDVQLVKLSSDSELALSVSKYDKALVWKAANGQEIHELPLSSQKLARGLRITAAAFSADNQWLITGRPDQRVDLWHVEQGEIVKSWRLPKRDAWKPTGAAVMALGFGAQDTYYVATSNGFIHTLKRN